MTPTNVVSMNFKDKESLDDFVKMYQKDSPKLYPDAEILMFIKLTDTSAVAISVYPNEEARINSKKLAESRVSGELKQLFEEDFRLSGDMVVKHIIEKTYIIYQEYTCLNLITAKLVIVFETLSWICLRGCQIDLCYI